MKTKDVLLKLRENKGISQEEQVKEYLKNMLPNLNYWKKMNN